MKPTAAIYIQAMRAIRHKRRRAASPQQWLAVLNVLFLLFLGMFVHSAAAFILMLVTYVPETGLGLVTLFYR